MAKENYKISVVIPVYNVEKYLRECVDSVLGQTYKNIEVILVDDGATDSCPQICDDYANQDNRIKVVHKENGGLSDARNFGIDASTGDYIMFIDSDDYWDSNTAVEHIVDIIDKEHKDVVLFFFKYFYEDEQGGRIVEYNKNFKNIKINGKSKAEQMSDIIKNHVYLSASWTKAIKRDLFIKNDLYFVKDILSEDIDWSARLMLYAESFSLLNESFYIYRQRSTSITHTKTKKNIVHIKNNIIKCIEIADNFDISEREIYLQYVAYQYITFLNVCCVCKDNIKTELNEMKKYSYLLNYNWNPKVKKVYTFKKLLGFNLMMKVLKLYIKLK